MKPHSSRLNDKLFTFGDRCYDFFMLQTDVILKDGLCRKKKCYKKYFCRPPSEKKARTVNFRHSVANISKCSNINIVNMSFG